MKNYVIASLAGLTVAGASNAAFVSFVVTSANTTNSGQALTVYNVFARFNGATDTLLNAYNFAALGGSSLTDFWHKDLNSSASNVLTQAYGTWSPSRVGSATLNRPFDSYLTIGNQAVGTNTTNADPSWPALEGGWDRPTLPGNGTIGWFNSSPPNNQGRVGIGVNTATDVRVGQFVLSQGDVSHGQYSLTIGYNDGLGGAAQFATGTFNLPAPGALALLGLAGFAGRRRR
jgi:hypothetical protein